MKTGLIFLMSSIVWAGEGMVNLTFSNGDYWRGLQYSDTATFQPEVAYSFGSWTAMAWGSMDLSDEHQRFMELNRHELSIQFDHEWKRLWFTTGLSSHKTYGSEGETTHEWFTGLNLDSVLQPAVQVYYDFDRVDGWYGQLGIFPVLPLFQTRRSQGVELSAMVGFGSTDYKGHYFNMNHGDPGTGNGGDGGHGDGHGDGHHGSQPGPASSGSGLLQASLNLDYPIRLSKGSLIFSIGVLMYLDDDIRSPMNQQDDRFWTAEIAYRLVL